MPTPTSTKAHLQMHAAIFEHGDTPDVECLRRLVAEGGLDEFDRKLALIIINSEERAERKKGRAARYLRHYQRIAAKLS